MKKHGCSLSRREFLLTGTLAGSGLLLPISASAQNSMRMPMQQATPPAQDQKGSANVTFGIVYIELKNEKGDFDQEIFLATHEFNPYYTGGEMEEMEREAKPEDPALEAEVEAAKDQKPNGWEISYDTFTINGQCLGFGDPIRVKEGQRV